MKILKELYVYFKVKKLRKFSVEDLWDKTVENHYNFLLKI